MDGREGPQRGVDAEDCGLSLEQANVSRDVMHIVETMSPPYRTSCGLLTVPYSFSLQVIACRSQLPGSRQPACVPMPAHTTRLDTGCPRGKGSASGWKCSMHLTASGRAIGGTRSGGSTLDGEPVRGCVTDAVTNAPSCVEGFIPRVVAAIEANTRRQAGPGADSKTEMLPRRDQEAEGGALVSGSLLLGNAAEPHYSM